MKFDICPDRIPGSGWTPYRILRVPDRAELTMRHQIFGASNGVGLPLDAKK